MTNQTDYPNVEFPYNYTKNGQKELLDKYINNKNEQIKGSLISQLPL